MPGKIKKSSIDKPPKAIAKVSSYSNQSSVGGVGGSKYKVGTTVGKDSVGNSKSMKGMKKGY